MNHRTRIKQHIGTKIKDIQPLSGGVNAQIYRVMVADSQTLVAKVSDAKQAMLDIEGRMLRYLSQNSDLPVPEVIHSEADLLIMTYIETQGGITKSVEESAAHHLATLHSIASTHYGLPFDTLIGGLHQPNPQYDTWIDFFREQRLLYMAQVAYEAGQLPASVHSRIGKFAGNLEDFLFEPEQPALIHGDIWGGNVLAYQNRIAGFVDPAIYYAHHEIELAFSTLFNTFSQAFFDVYRSIRPIEPDFFSVRRDIYNLYPLLVHVRLFGGGYVSQVDSVLKQMGY